MACGAPVSTPAQTESQPTEAAPVVAPPTETPMPLPTDTPVPTSTSTPTPLPEGVIFRDDFSGALQPGWSWENEKPDRWKITDDGWLQIRGEDSSALAGQNQSNMLFRDLPTGNFMVTVHVTAATDSNFQQAAVFLYEDVNNYVAINRGFCEPCFPGNGNGIFMDYKIGGKNYWLGNNKVKSDPVDVYLRLVSKDKIIYGYYAFEPNDWKLLTRLGDFFEFKRVGVGVTNSDPNGVDSDLIGSFDYFEISNP
jgi:regulation of enolase protein 1 (concanavalin A-like superfamily)